MGVGPSKNPEQERLEREEREKIYLKNAKQLVGGNDYVATSLNINDLNTDIPSKNKPVLPNLSNKHYLGGSNLSRESSRNRYDQFNIFDALNKYETNMKGGSHPETLEQVTVTKIVEPNRVEVDVRDNQTSDDALEKVRNTILSHLEQLNKNKVGGGCGCENYANSKGGSTNMLATGPQKKLYRDDSDTSSTTSTSSASTTSSHTSSSEFGRKKSKSKGKKKTSTKFNIEESSSNFIVDSSESGAEPELKPRGRKTRNAVDTSNGDDSSSSSSESDSEEGLSIFPFNSSDVNSSVSSKNFKTLRRRV